VEVAAIVLAFALVGGLFMAKAPAELTPWHGTFTGGHFSLSPAGWWLLLVSLPLLIVLELGWVWRLMLWARFLWQMSRLRLRLVPAHPDHTAGLKFVDYSVRALLPLGLVLGILAAGPVMDRVVHDAVSPAHFKFTILVYVVVVLAILLCPLLAFTGRLTEERRRGVFLYGALAATMGREFEKKWFASRQMLDQGALSVPDFSSTTDLYSVAANAYAMKVVPLELKDLALLGLAILVPFIPVVLLTVPLSVILDKVASLFL